MILSLTDQTVRSSEVGEGGFAKPMMEAILFNVSRLMVICISSIYKLLLRNEVEDHERWIYCHRMEV